MSLKLSGVGKSFQQGASALKIITDLNLEMQSGEILAVVGESGSGKSTLLSLIAGFEKPDAGEISWNGAATRSWSDDDWARFRKENLGFVFQHYHLIPYLSASENVALPLRLLGREDFAAQTAELLAQLGMSDRGHHLPAQLSGGERQRVAIARALIHRPSLVLADEPTGSLDVKTGDQVLQVLFGILRERKQTAMVVTHSQEVAARCDRVLTLKQGKLWSP
ncbi:MAG: ABC transporter ATP-binding protein [Bdellovibrionales bacterium]